MALRPVKAPPRIVGRPFAPEVDPDGKPDPQSAYIAEQVKKNLQDFLTNLENSSNSAQADIRDLKGGTGDSADAEESEGSTSDKVHAFLVMGA